MIGPARRRRGSADEPVLLVMLGVLVVAPLVVTVWTALGGGLAGAGDWPTLRHLTSAAIDARLAPAIAGSVRFAVGSALLASAIGGYLAWVTERTAAPFRRTLQILTIAPIVIPGALSAVAWVLLLHPRIGVLTIATGGFPFTLPFDLDAHTMTAMVWAEAADGVTLPFLMIAAGLRSMDPAHEEASRMSGASTTVTVARVTGPLLRPAILAALLVGVIRSLGSFAVPGVMGIPGGVRTLATEVFLATRRFPVGANVAAAFALVHIVPALLLLLVYRRAVGNGAFATRPRGGVPPRRRPTRSDRIHGAVAAVVLIAIVVAPVAVIVASSLQPFPGPLTLASITGGGLENYRWAVASTLVRRAVQNTLVVGLLSALLSVAIGVLVARATVRGRGRLRPLLDALASIPLAIPGPVLALALMTVLLITRSPLYASLGAIVLGLTISAIPYTVRAADAALRQIDPALEEASAVVGVGGIRTVLHVVVPLTSRGLLAGAIYVMARAFTALAVPALLAGPGDELLPVVVLNLAESARYPEVNAIGVLVILLLLAIALLARVLARRPRGDRRTSAPAATAAVPT